MSRAIQSRSNGPSEAESATWAPVEECRRRVIERLGLPADVCLAVGVDRFDYTKGILERLNAVERLLEKWPDWIGRFVFVQVAAPTRSALDEYRSFQEQVQRATKRINDRFGNPGYQPVHLLARHHEHEAVNELFRAANICVVTSLHDGMNLVCKEFVAARDDLQGVLVLSRFAGAARELSEALIVNPYHVEETADALNRAATMPSGEQRERMASLRSTVREFNVFRWAGRMLSDAGRWRLRCPHRGSGAPVRRRIDPVYRRSWQGMLHLFTTEGLAALAQILRQRPLLAFDFDGTLAPIVARPEDARISLAVANRLKMLGTRLPIAIVTGRSVDDARGRLRFTPHYIVGNHGAEDGIDIAGAATRVRKLDRIRQMLHDHRAELGAVGVVVEDKGQSIALHYRLSREQDLALGLIQHLLATPDPSLHVFPGKMVVNIAPTDAPDKALAVHELLARCGASCALFAGDDVNDEPVFVSASQTWLTVRVGRNGPPSRARFFLDGPSEMPMLLDRMLKLLLSHGPP